MKKISLHWKIIALTFFIVLFSFSVAGIFVLGNILETKEKDLSNRAMLLARTVSELPEVKQNIDKGIVASETINPVVEEMRIINKADYIVVLNMNRIRLSHPIDRMIGTISKTEDESAAFVEHTYLSKAKGEAGTVVRAFVPIMDDQYEQVGVVTVSYTHLTLPTMAVV